MIQINSIRELDGGCEVTGTDLRFGDGTMFLKISEEDLLSGLAEMQKGILIQEALPMLNPDEREFLIVGLTPERWTEVFMGMLMKFLEKNNE